MVPPPASPLSIDRPEARFDSVTEIIGALRAFRAERDWEQYHTPKNLSISVVVEATELLEHFQWLSDDEAQERLGAKRQEIAAELADIAIYVLQFADVTGISLADAIAEKLRLNAEKYPPRLASGTNKKYTELREA